MNAENLSKKTQQIYYHQYIIVHHILFYAMLHMRMILHLDLISFLLGYTVKIILQIIYKFLFHPNTDLTNAFSCFHYYFPIEYSIVTIATDNALVEIIYKSTILVLSSTTKPAMMLFFATTQKIIWSKTQELSSWTHKNSLVSMTP